MLGIWKQIENKTGKMCRSLLTTVLWNLNMYTDKRTKMSWSEILGNIWLNKVNSFFFIATFLESLTST